MPSSQSVPPPSLGKPSSLLSADAATNHSGGGGEGLLVATTPTTRQAVSLLTCSKLCAICFVAGVVFGFTLQRRVRRWASKLLKKIRD